MKSSLTGLWAWSRWAIEDIKCSYASNNSMLDLFEKNVDNHSGYFISQSIAFFHQKYLTRLTFWILPSCKSSTCRTAVDQGTQTRRLSAW